jgi:molecular chaperone GrpE (heat shock protein)
MAGLLLRGRPWYPRDVFSSLRRLLAPPTLPEGPPPWAAELSELVQKTSRAQSRLSVKLDSVEGKLEAGLQDLREAIRLQEKAAAGSGEGVGVGPVLDAMDLLEAAIEVAARAKRTEGDAVAEGLRRVLERLHEALDSKGIKRLSTPGEAPDGRYFRVVGGEARADLPPGMVSRVVRAAAACGGRVLREGEVIISE